MKAIEQAIGMRISIQYYNSKEKMEMNTNYDLRQHRHSYDRRLTILRSKIGKLPTSKTKTIVVDEPNNLEDMHTEQNLSLEKRRGREALFDKASIKKSAGFIKLFINQLKNNSSTSISDHRIRPNHLTRLIQKIYYVSDPRSTLGPKGIVVTEAVQLLITIITVLSILFLHFLSTFQFLFQDFRDGNMDTALISTLICICLICTIIKITSSFLFKITVVGKRLDYISQIAFNYITDIDFYLDFLVLISAILLIAFPEDQFSGIFGFLASLMNVAYIERLENAIDIIIITNNSKRQIFALFKLLLANFFMVHLFGSVMITVTLFESSPTWIDKYNIADSEWWVKYLYSTYWSATIITTVGFGDIIVSNIYQAVALTVVILIGCIVLSYNIAQVGMIINSLSQVPNEVRNQLSILRRLANVTKIDSNLHHSMGEYIIHAAEINKSFELKEREELINMLPYQMREEFLRQSSKNFCTTLPFFYMLQNETKRFIRQKIKIQVLSPNQYITHKKHGLTQVFILRKGVLGLAFKKKGSMLNGAILDTIQIKSESENSELLNMYLLVRGKKLVYDLICQEYCVVARLEFEDFIEALKDSERDFQLFHQCRDEVTFKINDWTRKICEYCHLKHTIFVCPKLHFMPLRGITFLKYQKIKSKPQGRPIFHYLREKVALAKRSPVKLWKRMFVPIQNAFDTQIQKEQSLRMKKNMSTDSQQQKQKQSWQSHSLFQQYFLRYYERTLQFQLDLQNNFKFYFEKQNPEKLIETHLSRQSIIFDLDRMRSY